MPPVPLYACRKQFISRLGQDDQIQDGLTKGEASNIISDAKASGATNNTNGSNAPQGPRGTGAAADNTPGALHCRHGHALLASLTLFPCQARLSRRARLPTRMPQSISALGCSLCDAICFWY